MVSPFWDRASNVYDQFLRYLQWTKGHTERTKFPKTEANAFVDRLNNFYNLAQCVSALENDQDFKTATKKFNEYMYSLKITAQNLQGKEGIRAFSSLLRVSLDLFEQIDSYLAKIKYLESEDTNLRSKIDELELIIAEMNQREAQNQRGGRMSVDNESIASLDEDFKKMQMQERSYALLDIKCAL